MIWFVYILLCIDDSYYTGVTNDVDRRFRDHLNGDGARYTKSHPPIKILFTEQCKTKSEALKREAEIKSWTRKKKEMFIRSTTHHS